jgi:hypothetical protein
MSERGRDHILIPALITAAAAYFGFKKKSENISEIAKTLVHRAVKDQVRTNHKAKRAKKRNYRRSYNG